MGDGMKYCWSCIEHEMYQHSLQPDSYDPSEDSKEFIKQYQDMGNPIIECNACGSKARYQKQSDSWYIELKEETM